MVTPAAIRDSRNADSSRSRSSHRSVSTPPNSASTCQPVNSAVMANSLSLSARDMNGQGRKTIEGHRRIARGICAGVEDLNAITGSQRGRQKDPCALIQYIVAVTGRTGQQGLADGVSVSFGYEAVADVLVLGHCHAVVA